LFVLTEVAGGIMNVVLVFIAIKLWKLEGVGIAFALVYVFYTMMMLAVAFKLTGFKWSNTALKILVSAFASVIAVFLGARFFPPVWALTSGIAVTLIAGVVSLAVLQKLLGINLCRALLDKIRSKTA
jgi:O-antigen/teichoic acid export membrane protein